MRTIGTRIYGLRLPVISEGDDLAGIIADCVGAVQNTENVRLSQNDIIGITESIVAKSQGNYATTCQIAKAIKTRFAGDCIGLVFPIFSRNRFASILKAASKAKEKVYVLFQFPSDEVGNPIVDPLKVLNKDKSLISAKDFREKYGLFKHPFTDIDYISYYESMGDNVEVYLSSNPCDILKLTENILVCEIHNRFLTKATLERCGAQRIFMLSDLLNESIDGSGYNPEFGLLGSNLAGENTVKLFPKYCDDFIDDLLSKLKANIGLTPEILIFGDGAYKDPASGIWELADPVVSPAFTKKLGGFPNEIKLKFIADTLFADLDPEDKQKAVSDYIKQNTDNNYRDGTTPRRYSDLLGSLCDLVSGSGDRGTPIVLIQGYFDNYSTD
jgi:hypothetical protein